MLGTANIKIRPLKLAMLVDPNSASQVREAIRLSCSLWGGMFFPIITLYKRMPPSWRNSLSRAPLARDVVHGYIEAFDPDIFVQFSDNLPSYITDLQIKVVKPQEIWSSASSIEEPFPSFGIGVFDVLGDIYKEHFKYAAKYPSKVVIPKIPQKHGVFWASVLGEYSENISLVIERHFSAPLDITNPNVTPEAILELTDQMTLFPRRITAWALTPHGTLRFGRDACVYFMDASNLEDVVDYWNLRATGRSVIPMPKQFLISKEFSKLVEDFILQERRPWRHNPNNFDTASFIRSRHTTMEEMSAYAATLNLPKLESSHPGNHYFSLQHWYPRIWDEWGRSKDGGVLDIYGEEEDVVEVRSASDLEIRIKPLTPKFGRDNWPWSQGLCANEFDLRMFGADEHLAEVYPKTPGEHLTRAIAGARTVFDEWRIGRHGLVKIVQRLSTEIRKVPASEEIFFAWLKDRGWKAELSPPGILAKQIYKRLGGATLQLANRSVLGLIEHMNGGSINRDGTPISGGKIGAERELSVGEVKSRLNGNNELSRRYENFIERGIFKLGLRTKCPNCQRNTWFALSSLRESLECPKCLNQFAAAGNIEQVKSNWHYRTTGPFSVPNFADGAFAVLLTLDALGSRRNSSVRTTQVPSFVASSHSKVKLEADFAMFWREPVYGEDNEGLLFGECKTYGLFEKNDIEKMQYIGETFPGAILVFSTLRESLTSREISALRKLAKSGRKYWKAERPINPVLILTGAELLTWKSPPMCWDESNRGRFQDARDLLSLCNATQQIYLNLPSWHEDWVKQWKK